MREFCHFYGIDFEQRLPRVDHRVGAVTSGEFTLAVHTYRQPGASSNLLLVHGYLDHSGLFGHLIEYGLQRGSNVVIFDLPGHGLSTGAPAVIDDFKEYSRAITAVLEAVSLPALPWWAMAQSAGCSVLMEFSRRSNWPFTATVFLAPLIRPKGWNLVRLAHALLHRFIDSSKRNFAENSSDKAFLAFLREDPLQSHRISMRWVGALRRWLAGLEFEDLGVGPLLVIQGEADRTVAWRYNMKHIVELFPGCQIEYLTGAGHHLANETADIRRRYLKKVHAFLEGVPSLPDAN